MCQPVRNLPRASSRVVAAPMRGAGMAGWPVALDRAGIMDPSLRRDYTEQRRPVARFACAEYTAVRLLLPPVLVPDVLAATAFMHHTDDRIDQGPVAERAAARTAWDEQVRTALAGGPTDEPLLRALRHTVTRHPQLGLYVREFLPGAADVDWSGFATERDFQDYIDAYSLPAFMLLTCLLAPDTGTEAYVAGCRSFIAAMQRPRLPGRHRRGPVPRAARHPARRPGPARADPPGPGRGRSRRPNRLRGPGAAPTGPGPGGLVGLVRPGRAGGGIRPAARPRAADPAGAPGAHGATEGRGPAHRRHPAAGRRCPGPPGPGIPGGAQPTASRTGLRPAAARVRAARLTRLSGAPPARGRWFPATAAATCPSSPSPPRGRAGRGRRR